MVRLKADSLAVVDHHKVAICHRTIESALGLPSSVGASNDNADLTAFTAPQELGAPHPDEDALKIIAQRIPEYQAPVSTDRVVLEDLSEKEEEQQEVQRQKEMELDSNSSLTDLSEDEDEEASRIKKKSKLSNLAESNHPNPISKTVPTNSALTLRELAEGARIRAGHLPSSQARRYHQQPTESIGGISKDEIHQLRAVRDLMKNVGEKRLLEFLVEENSKGKKE